MQWLVPPLICAGADIDAALRDWAQRAQPENRPAGALGLLLAGANAKGVIAVAATEPQCRLLQEVAVA